MSREEFDAVDGLYAALTHGHRLQHPHAAVLRMRPGRHCLTVRDGQGRLAGIAIFYFNLRDWIEGSVHEAYIGLVEDARGQGLATFMRRHALQHFASSDLARCSSRVTLDNTASLQSNLKLGYVPVESYFDPARKELRQYLVCDLGRYRRAPAPDVGG